ncbi:hypothetical protein ACE6H2_006721 [Prunus campanulata]
MPSSSTFELDELEGVVDGGAMLWRGGVGGWILRRGRWDGVGELGGEGGRRQLDETIYLNDEDVGWVREGVDGTTVWPPRE